MARERENAALPLALQEKKLFLHPPLFRRAPRERVRDGRRQVFRDE